MKQQITQTAVDAGQNWSAQLMLALGFTSIPFSVLIAGLFFAMAAGSIVAQWRKSPRNKFLIIAAAIFFGLITAWIWPRLGWDLPVQLGMAVVGGLSSWLMNVIVKVADGVEQRTDVIADRVIDRVLPDKGDYK